MHFSRQARPRFLIEAAQAAFDQGHFAAGMALARVAVPSFDSRKSSELPLNTWKALYPLPYESPIRGANLGKTDSIRWWWPD